MFGLPHRTVLLTPTEDAFDHCAARLRYSVAFVPVDGALAASAGFGNAIVLRHMRCDVPGAKILGTVSISHTRTFCIGASSFKNERVICIVNGPRFEVSEK